MEVASIELETLRHSLEQANAKLDLFLRQQYANVQHDALCWRDVGKRSDASDYIKNIAELRMIALKAEAAQIRLAITNDKT